MSDYIKDLRNKVGNMPIILCCVGVFVQNEKNEILLIKRSDDNCWALPAGCSELGETIEAGARRETFEETGIALGKLELIGVYSGEDLHYIYPNGDEIYAVFNAFKSKDYTGALAPDGFESKAVGFFPMNNLPQNLHKPEIPVIRDFINKELS